MFIDPILASTDNLSPDFTKYKENYASGKVSRYDSNIAVSYLTHLTNQLAETLDSSVARDLGGKIKRILGSGEGVGGLMKVNPLNPRAHYANEQQTKMLLRSIMTVEKLRKNNIVDFKDYTETKYSNSNDDEAKHALALWAIAQGSQIARQHQGSIDIYAELSKLSPPIPIVASIRHYLKDLQTTVREIRIAITEIENAKELFEKTTLTEGDVKQIMQLHNDWEIFFDENLNLLKLPAFDSIDDLERQHIIRELFNSYQHRKNDSSKLVSDIEIDPSINAIEENTGLLKETKDERIATNIASKLAKAVGKTIPTTAAAKETIKNAIIAIEQARKDERTVALKDYLTDPEDYLTATDATKKEHALRIWIIAFGAQRAIYNEKNGDLEDVLQNLDLLRSNPEAKFVRDNWDQLNPAQVLGKDFVREVNANVPSIVNVRRLQQLLRIHAQTKKLLEHNEDNKLFLDSLNEEGIFFDAQFNPIEQSYLKGKPALAEMMLNSMISNTSETYRRLIPYTDSEGKPLATKLYYKNHADGQCGFYGLNKDRPSSSAEMVWNLGNPDVKQWVTAATLQYLDPIGGMRKSFYIESLKGKYEEKFSNVYEPWKEFVAKREENSIKRSAAIIDLEKERNRLIDEGKGEDSEERKQVAAEIDAISKPFTESNKELGEKIDAKKMLIKQFLEGEGVLQWIITELFEPSEWIQFSGAGPDENMLDFGDVIAFLNNLKVYTITSGYSQNDTDMLGVIANKDKANAKEIFLYNPSHLFHYDRLVDWDNWREQIRAERHEKGT